MKDVCQHCVCLYDNYFRMLVCDGKKKDESRLIDLITRNSNVRRHADLLLLAVGWTIPGVYCLLYVSDM